MKRTSLIILSLMLFAGGAWALEKEDAIELTCKLDLVVFQLHLTQDESTSWYKVTRKSNKPIFDLLEHGRPWRNISMSMLNVSLEIFFPSFHLYDLDSYFDLPQYKIRLPLIENNYLRFSLLPVTKKRGANSVSNHTINRTTGNIISYSNYFPSKPSSGNCVQGLVDWIEKEVERKF